jgi:hypothetical protein
VTPELLDVPGRSDIRIHIGNFPQDTLGCLLVGEMKGQDKIFNSKPAFEKLLLLLKTATDPIIAVFTDQP